MRIEIAPMKVNKVMWRQTVLLVTYDLPTKMLYMSTGSGLNKSYRFGYKKVK